MFTWGHETIIYCDNWIKSPCFYFYTVMFNTSVQRFYQLIQLFLFIKEYLFRHQKLRWRRKVLGWKSTPFRRKTFAKHNTNMYIGRMQQFAEPETMTSFCFKLKVIMKEMVINLFLKLWTSIEYCITVYMYYEMVNDNQDWIFWLKIT